MKKVFLLMLALASSVHATDTAMICSQQGFQVGVNFGWANTQPSNTKIYNFETPTETAAALGMEVAEGFQATPENAVGSKVYALALNYSNISTWQSDSALTVGLNVAYKWLLNCNQYSVTAAAFMAYNSVSMTSNLQADSQNYEVELGDGTTTSNAILGSVGTDNMPAGDLKLSSGPVFGFRFLLAKEFNWGNAGLVLGMKFNSYKLRYAQVNPELVEAGVSSRIGTIDLGANPTTDLNIDGYLTNSSKTHVATGFTVGFATNYYIAENLSAGFTVYYDMYAPVTFNLENIAINPYVFEEGGEQVTDTGSIKFNNSTIGVEMNLTYSFGAN